MRKVFFLFLLFCCFSDAFTQSSFLISEYRLPDTTGSVKSVLLNMPFGKPDVISIDGDTSGLRNAGDIIVDIVYTDYPSRLTLKTLNTQRFENIFFTFPFLHKEKLLQVNYYRQTNGAVKEMAWQLFHGIVIRYRPAQNPETMKADLEKLERLLLPVSKDSGLKITKDTSSSTASTISWVSPDTTATPIDSVIVITPLKAYKEGYIDKAAYKLYKKFGWLHIHLNGKDTEGIPIDSILYNDSVQNETVYALPDSTVLTIFSRNKWKGPTIVGDVTGSMYPYTAQLLLWLKLNNIDSFSTRYVFFNDGNNDPDEKKILGKTGGIYIKECHGFEEVKALVKETMRNGGGGDCPENNIEALLISEKKYPDAPFQVLIADNWADIKDISLIDSLRKPVRIVLCGATDGYVNVNYLNLARKSGGSVHLIEEDIFSLANLQEGAIIKIGRAVYKIVNGNFVQVF